MGERKISQGFLGFVQMFSHPSNTEHSSFKNGLIICSLATKNSGFPGVVFRIFNKPSDSQKECHFSYCKGLSGIPRSVLIIMGLSSVFWSSSFCKRQCFFKHDGSGFFISLLPSLCLSAVYLLRNALGIHTNGILAPPIPSNQTKCSNLPGGEKDQQS